MQNSKYLQCILPLSLFLLTSCSLPKPTEGLKNSTFQVESVDGSMNQEELGDLGLPKNRTYQINVCLKDIKTQQILINQKFDIQGENTNLSSVTDEKGCLHWQEKISFNSLSDSKFILFNRDLVAKSKNFGTHTLKLAMNPWLDSKESKIIDISKNSVSPLISDQNEAKMNLLGIDVKSNKKIQKNLWAEDGRLFVFDEQFIKDKGVQLTFDIRLNPAIILKKLNGEKYFQALTDGKLKAKFYLFSTTMNNGKADRSLLSSSGDFKVYSIKNNQISIKEQLLIAKVPKRGQILMAIHLKSDEDNLTTLKNQILDFKGIYPLGEYDSLKNTAFLKVSSDISEVQSVENNFEIKYQESSDSFHKAKYELAPIESKFLKIISDNSQNRKISYNIKLCMINGIDHKPLRGEDIKVESETFHQTISFDINSCVSVDDTLSFEPYSCQHYIKKDYKISSSTLGIDEVYSILINPWEPTIAGSFRDLRYASKDDLNQQNCSKDKNIASHLQIDNFHFTQNSLNYHFDKNLSLEIIKNVFIKMEPKVITPSSFTNGTSEISPLRNGAYRVRIAVIRNQKNLLDSYITHTEKFVNVVDGKINAEFDLKISELKQLGIRNNVLIDIAPLNSNAIEIKDNGQIIPRAGLQDFKSIVDEANPLAKGLFIGPIILNNDQSTTPLMPINNSDLAHYIATGKNKKNEEGLITLSQIIDRGLTIKAEQQKLISKISTRNHFASINNLDIVALKFPAYSPVFFKNWNVVPEQSQATVTAAQNDSIEAIQSEVNSIIDSNKINFQQRQKLCNIWTSQIFKSYRGDLGGALPPAMKDAFNSVCLRHDSKNPFFVTEKRIFVHETGTTELIDGRNFNINSGTNFAVSRTHTDSTTRSTSVSANVKVPEVITQFLPLNASLNYSISSSTQVSESEAFSTNFGSNLSLVVQQNLFNIEFTQYEQCLIVKINPYYLHDRKVGPVTLTKGLAHWMNPRMTPAEKFMATEKGLLLCKGQIETKKIQRSESQFAIFQDLKNTEIQDSGNEKLRSFYLTLRGQSDYARFVNSIKGQSTLPKEQVLELKADEQHGIMTKLNGLMHKTPTHPGVYLDL